MQIIAVNKKANHDFLIKEKFDAGIVLTGSEVKSLRINTGSIKESYVLEEKGEHQEALDLVDSAMAEFDTSIQAHLMRLKLSLTTLPPHELSQQIDKIMELVTGKKEKI